jgi:hypothetical protein
MTTCERNNYYFNNLISACKWAIESISQSAYINKALNMNVYINKALNTNVYTFKSTI